jgi:phosphoglycerate dehydrogenase-like enzyme
MRRKKALYILNPDSGEKIYGPDERRDIEALVEVYAPPQTPAAIRENPALLKSLNILFSGWGGPKIDAEFLAAAPALEAVFYGAGSVRGIVSEAFWERNIVLTSSWGANGIPVAEYALAQILFSLKLGWRHVFDIRREGRYPPRYPVPGAYGSTVAVISLGMIGRRVCELLRPFALTRIACDPFVAPEQAAALGVRLVSLEEAFRTADVVTLHTPWLKETEGMITGELLRSMKRDATFINTARGAVVDEPALIRVLGERPDLTAVLDVTHPEPPPAGSPLYTLPNAVLTPHIAGSMDGECRRMGRFAVEECRRYLAGEPLRWRVTREQAAIMA